MEDTRNSILSRLLAAPNEFVSGAALSRALGISRAAVWKHIRALGEEGVVIEGISKKGYRVVSLPDRLHAEYLSPFLRTESVGRSLVCLESTVSTNSDARALALSGCPGGLTVIAEEQTGGRGRRGRQWLTAPYTGVSMSIVLRPEISPALAPRFTLAAALAVQNAFSLLGTETKIKWPNDVLCRGRKLSGILLEMGGSTEKLDYIVIGIGLNVNQTEYPEEIKGIATSLALEQGKTLNRCRVAAEVLNALEPLCGACRTEEGYRGLMEEYRRVSQTLGQSVKVIGVNETLYGVAEDFDSLGRIVLRLENGTVRHIDSGDVTLRTNEGES